VRERGRMFLFFFFLLLLLFSSLRLCPMVERQKKEEGDRLPSFFEHSESTCRIEKDRRNNYLGTVGCLNDKKLCYTRRNFSLAVLLYM
jgi:hypothetical protein